MQTEREWSAVRNEQDKVVVAKRSAFGAERAKLEAAGLRLDDKTDAVVARQDSVMARMNETPAKNPVRGPL